MLKMLIVDDEEINRLILRELFEDQFDVLEADNGAKALKIINKYKQELSVIMLDIVMPVRNGFDVLIEMNETGLIKSVPVILITSDYHDDNLLLGYKLGVSDIANKPINGEIIQKRVENVVDLYAYKNHLEQKTKEQMEKIELQTEKLKQSNQFVIDALSTTMEFRSMESGEHIKNVRYYTKLFLESVLQYYPLTFEQIQAISDASAMHDIGKIAIPDRILLKPGRLTPREFDIMKTHTTRGCEILKNIDHTQEEEFYTYCYEICKYHHEKWDGKGYPTGIKGDKIPIWAQAASLADVYDALTSKRVYKDAYSHKKAMEMIVNGECGVFNPKLIEGLHKVKNELSDMR